MRLAHRLDLGSNAIGGPVELRTGLDVAGTGYSEAPGGCEMRSDWADLSAVTGIGSSWAHGGLVASPAGGVIGFDSSGRYVSALSGEEGAGRFDCPHALLVDGRRATIPKLYITDRGNRRVQVYDLEGQYLRSFGDGVLNSPSALVRWGELLRGRYHKVTRGPLQHSGHRPTAREGAERRCGT